MKKNQHKISAAQFFVAMFVSRAAVTIALSARYTGSGNPLDSIVSYLLSMGLGFLIALPIWGLHRYAPDQDIGAAACRGMGSLGKLVPLCYILYFVLVNGASLALFQMFLLDTVNPDFSAGFVVAAVAAVALYGALRGIETVARCGSFVFAVVILGSLLVFGIVAGRFQAENLEPLFYQGFAPAARGTALFIARTSIFADMAVLLPQVKGRKGLGFAGWMGGTALFVCTLLLLLAGCLGRYAATQNFPVYALASITEIRSLQRLDAVFIGVWIMALIIKLACDLYACRVCFSALGGKKGFWGGLSITLIALGALALALLGSASSGGRELLLNTGLLFWCTVATGFLLPLLVLLAARARGRKGDL